MRIHSLLIAGALAGLMATAGSMHAQEVKKPPEHPTTQQQQPKAHQKKASKHNESQAAMKGKEKSRTEPGTVSKELMGKSGRHNERYNSHEARSSKHHPKSSNASMHHKKHHQNKSASKSYQ